MKRYGETSLQDDFTYAYVGNQLVSLNNGLYEFEYDANGNCTFDGLNNLNLKYNYLNLISDISQGNDEKAKYHWLADGSKVSVRAYDGNGDPANGFEYLGSLVYKHTAFGLQLESAAFSNGRIIASQGAPSTTYTPNYHIIDHLGSVRTIIDNNGLEIGRNDYMPFGTRWSQLGDAAQTRYQYNGKEDQSFADVNYLDYGARMYNARTGRWNGIDNLAEKYLDTSPYDYCVNNPANAIDPDGRLIIFVNGFNPAQEILNPAAQTMGSGMTWTGSFNDRSFQKEDFYGWDRIPGIYNTAFNDDNHRYVDGSFPLGTSAQDRYNAGVSKGNELITLLESGKMQLKDGEKIRLVGYSMGAAFAAGMAAAIMQNENYRDLLALVDYLAPFQPDKFAHPDGVLGRQFVGVGDRLSNYEKIIQGVEIHRAEDINSMFRGHTINDSFSDFIQRCIDAGVTVTVYY